MAARPLSPPRFSQLQKLVPPCFRALWPRLAASIAQGAASFLGASAVRIEEVLDRFSNPMVARAAFGEARQAAASISLSRRRHARLQRQTRRSGNRSC